MRIAEGDESAFGILYRLIYPLLQPVCKRSEAVGIPAEDIMQLTFLKVWLNREQLPGIVNLNAWIIRIAYREYLMAVRKKLVYEEKIESYGRETATGDAPADLRASINEIKVLTQQVVNTLSPQRKAIYEMSREQGLSIKDIAGKLGISPNTVKSTLQTVLKMIREELTLQGFGPFSIIILLPFCHLG